MVDQLGMVSETFSPDNLIAGDNQRLITREGTLLSGENRARGTVLGRVGIALGAAVPDGGNTGDGTVTGVAGGDETQEGVYTLKCIATAVDGGTFEVLDPDNHKLGDAEVGVAYTSSQINFTINDGATDFVLDDEFTITASAGSAKLKMSVAAAVDGSEDPAGVLAEDCDASSEDKSCIYYVAGTFNEDAMTFGAGHTADSVRNGLEDKSIYLKSPVAG